MDKRKYPSKAVLITMLRFALIEIRASNCVIECRQLADVFHNLPSQLILDWNVEVAKSAYEKIIQKSKSYNIENYVLDLRISAEKSIGEH